jgi:hypothetical protein
MAYVTPRTVVPGEIWTASAHNQDVRDDIIDLNSRAILTQVLVQEDLAPTSSGSININDETTVITMSPTASYDYYGLTLPSTSPKAVEIVNTSGFNVTLKHESGSEATPAKRFYLPASGDLVMALGEACRLMHISVPLGARWVATGTAA